MILRSTRHTVLLPVGVEELRLLATHPPLRARLERLETGLQSARPAARFE